CLVRSLTGAVAWLYPFYALLTALCLTHAVFHPLWLVTAIGMTEGFRFAWRKRPDFRRGPSSFGAACVAFVLFLMLKNAALFGAPTLQSWFGMNLYNVAPKGEQARRVTQHGLTFPDAHAFAPFPEYVPAFDETPARGAAVLDNAFKAPGVPNFNYAGYLPVYGVFAEQAVRLILDDPGAYLGHLGETVRFFVRVPTHGANAFHGEIARRNVALMDDWVKRYDAWVYGFWLN